MCLSGNNHRTLQEHKEEDATQTVLSLLCCSWEATLAARVSSEHAALPEVMENLCPDAAAEAQRTIYRLARYWLPKALPQISPI